MRKDYEKYLGVSRNKKSVILVQVDVDLKTEIKNISKKEKIPIKRIVTGLLTKFIDEYKS